MIISLDWPKYLYSQIYPFANLYQAFRAAQKGGKRKQVELASFEFDLEQNLLELEGELRHQTYRPGGYRNFYIYEPKRRLVSAAPFRDRVVHHALCRVIEPIWEARFRAPTPAGRCISNVGWEPFWRLCHCSFRPSRSYIA